MESGLRQECRFKNPLKKTEWNRLITYSPDSGNGRSAEKKADDGNR
jgi:hypothetical protein